MRINKTTLSNGVRILSKKMAHLRSVSMGVWVSVGARDETPAQSGLSHFIEHMLFKGTAQRSAYEIAKAFDVIGGHTNAFTSMESTCYHARVMDGHLDIMTEILSDIFLNSRFAPEEVEKERPVIQQEIRMSEDAPEEHVHQLSEQAFWGDHPLGRSILGTPENIQTFDSQALQGFFRRFYQPERILIAAAGNVAHSHLVEQVAPAFEPLPRGEGPPPRAVPRFHSGVAVHYRDLEQAHLCIQLPGLPVTDSRRYAFSLLNSMVGGNMSSRLFQEIRERRSMAYSVYSFASAYCDVGAFGVYAGLDPEKLPTAVAVILNELNRLKTEPPTQQELADAKEYTKGCLMLAGESSDNQMARLAQNTYYFGEYIPMDQVIRGIEAVRPEALSELARLFTPEQTFITVLGPIKAPKALEKQLKEGVYAI